MSPTERDRVFYTTLGAQLERNVARLVGRSAPTGPAAGVAHSSAAAPVRAGVLSSNSATTRQPGERSSPSSVPTQPLTTETVPARTTSIGRCYLRELDHRQSLRDRRGFGMVMGSAAAAVLFMAAWLGIIG